MVVGHYKGEVPSRWETFHALPGVGDYIAAAVLSIAHDRPYAVVDGNVKRVLSRLGCVDIPVNRPAGHKAYQRLADLLLDRKNPGDHNQALMELGALICTPRVPVCDACVLARFCRAFTAGTVDRFPKRLQKPPSPQHRIAVGVVVKKGQLLLTRRKADGLLGGLWEFPGGKIGRKETPAEACVREIKEETGLEVTIDRHLTRVRHAYTHFKIVMDVFICVYQSGRVRLNGPVSHRWVTPRAIKNYPLPKANHKFLKRLADAL
jgi:A/G-specific adenine glycosylase